MAAAYKNALACTCSHRNCTYMSKSAPVALTTRRRTTEAYNSFC